MATKRPRSDRYSARSNPQRYSLDRIPPTLWAKVRAQAKREHISIRTLILGLLDGWLLGRDPKTFTAEALTLAREANPLPPALQAEFDAMERRRSAKARNRDVADE